MTNAQKKLTVEQLTRLSEILARKQDAYRRMAPDIDDPKASDDYRDACADLDTLSIEYWRNVHSVA